MITKNMQGLAVRESRLRLKQFLKDVKPSCQILCAQEHKIRAGSINILQMEIWNSTQFFNAPAVDGANAQRSDAIPARCGGAFIVVHNQLSPYII